MDILLSEEDIKKIVKDYLEAKNNTVEEIAIKIQNTDPSSSIMSFNSSITNFQIMFNNNEPNRPQIYLKCSLKS